MDALIRSKYWDNVKMLLMFFVVFGHTLVYTQWNSSNLLCVYNLLLSFQMPLFIFISGYFSKRITCPRKRDIEILLYPYLVFQVLNVFYVRYIEHNPASWNLFIPLHQNWYILALFIWRLIIPYFKYVTKWIGISIALGLSLIFSKYQVPDNLFALNYVFVFLPFFVLGYYIDEADIQRIQKRPFNILAIMAVLVLFAAIIVGTYHSTNFGLTITQAFKPPYICTSYISFGLRFVGFVLSFMLIYLMFVMKDRSETSNANRLDFSGGGTILVYLAHYFFVIPLWRVLPNLNWMISLVICIAISLILCWVFSRPIVIRIFAPLLDFGALREMYRKILNQ